MKLEDEIRHWKIFNILVRVAGFIFFIGGIGCGISGIGYIVNPEASVFAHAVVNVDDVMFKFLTMFFSLTFTLVGFFAMKLKSYFPKHIKDKM